jgi:hypothetical protein
MKKITGIMLAITALALVLCWQKGVAMAATTLNGTKPACLSRALLEEITGAGNSGDRKAFAYLLQHGCIVPKPGIEVSLIDAGWDGVAKVRAYLPGGKSVVLYTKLQGLEK